MPPEQMSLRLELFVQDMDQAIAFYTHILGFKVLRREEDYASLRNGIVILGPGPIVKLPEESGGYFTRTRLRADRGLGVEIVLEVDDVHAMYEHTQSCDYPIEEPLQKPIGDSLTFASLTQTATISVSYHVHEPMRGMMRDERRSNPRALHGFSEDQRSCFIRLLSRLKKIPDFYS